MREGLSVQVRFSIRYKILSVVTALLVVAICFYLLLATRIFTRDKTDLIYDLNRSLVATLSAEVESSLRASADKLRLYALLFAGRSDKKAAAIFEDIIASDPLLVRVELYERTSGGRMVKVSDVSEKNFQKLYALEDGFFDEPLPKQRPIPFEDIQSKSAAVWNATIPHGQDILALLGLGISVIQEGAHGAPEKMMAVVGYVRADSFVKAVRSSTLTQAFIVDSNGRVLIHSKTKNMAEVKDYSDSPIVGELRKGSISSGVLEFKSDGQNYLGAYSKAGFGGIGVVSQVNTAKAFEAVYHLVTRSLLFAMIVSTVTFIATIFFSRTLTQPLQKLVAAMEKVSEGKLDEELQIKSHDEIAVLSRSFNQMTSDLKTSRHQLEEINRELENKVIDRTRKLEEQNRAVKEAQEALLRTTRLASVGEIAGRTAHEVLNPLTSIMTRIKKVQKRLNDEVSTNKNLLGEISKAWKLELDEKGFEGFMKSLKEPSQINPEMTLLQEDLTNIAQIFSRWDEDMALLEKDTQFLLQQSGRIEKILGRMRSLSTVVSNRALFKAHAVIHDAVNILGDLFAKNKIEVIEKYEAGTDTIFVDRDELIQVLTNVLRNSLHAVTEDKTHKGLVRIETKNENQRLVIDVIDNGGGISAENQIKLFESQFSTKSPDQGTGLGLSISRRFVRAFNGDLVFVSSEPWKETRFRIELPLHQKAQEVAA